MVYCPIEELEKRVIARNVSGRMGEERSLEGALESFLLVYRPIDDKNSKSLGVISKEFVDLMFAKKSNNLDTKFKQEFISKMDLSKKDKIGVAPVLSYDLIVDNGPGRTAEQCADEIKKILPRKNFWDYIKVLPVVRNLFN